MKTFASDNYSGVAPEVMAKLLEANSGHAPSYGDDSYTQAAIERICQALGSDGPLPDVRFAYNGTGANILAMRALARPYESILCAACSHMNTNETGAPELITGCKLLPLGHQDGKIAISDVLEAVARSRANGVHAPSPRVVSITQCTELGAVYSPAELRALVEACHREGLYVHMDGCRLFNAAAALGTTLAELTTAAGIDALSFGGTKNGLMFGEVVVLFRPELTAGIGHMHKQSLQLHSKMRFLAAQFLALLEDDLGYRLARQANAMGARLHERLANLSGVSITRPYHGTNHVFVRFPDDVRTSLQARIPFYLWENTTGECRLVTSFDTTEEDVDELVSLADELLQGIPG